MKVSFLKATFVVLACVFAISFIAWYQTNSVGAQHASRRQSARGKSPTATNEPARASVAEALKQMPLRFEKNVGQTDARAKFISRGSGYSLFLTADEAVFALSRRASDDEPASADLADADDDSNSFDFLAKKQRLLGRSTTSVLRMKLAGNQAARITGFEELPGKINYFIGNDASKWKTDVPTYARIKYESIYPGVDLVYYGNQSQLEYDFHVAPEANPNQIRFRLEGAQTVKIDDGGDLVLQTSDGGTLRQHKPVIYQLDGENKTKIDGRYVIRRTGEIGFAVGKYDRKKPLVIDPVLSYSSYIGGNGADSVAVDANGNLYVAGVADTTFFPATPGSIQPQPGGAGDAFIIKFSSNNNELQYATYLGGAAYDEFYRVTADANGNAYLTGNTFSTNFPVTAGALQTQHRGGSDAFAAKINPQGNALLFSTLFGGTGDDYGFGIAPDAGGNVYLTGYTSSPDLQTTGGAFQTIKNGGFDGFAAKLNSNATSLVYSTFIGGGGNDSLLGFAADASGSVYLSGSTSSNDYPTLNPFQTSRTDTGVYVSRDRAQSFSQLPPNEIPDRVIFSIAVAPDDPNIIYTGTSGGIYKSTDGGQNSTRLSLQATGIRAIAINQQNSSIIYAGTANGVYKSTDAGATWTLSRNGFTATVGFFDPPTVLSLAVAPSDPNVIYAGTLSNGVYRTTDAGATWTQFNLNLPQFPIVNALAVDSSNAFRAYAAINGRGIFTSDANGWTASNNGLIITFQGNQTSIINVLSITIDRTNSSVIYLGTSGFGVYKSTNAGANWAASNNGLTFVDSITGNTSFATVRALVIDPQNNSTLYAGTNAGVYRSTDAGANWQQSNNGLLPNILSLAIANVPQGTPVLYAGVNGDSDVIVTKLNASGSALVYSTYLAGSSSDVAYGIAVDSGGNAYVTGGTFSANFPVTQGAIKTTHSFGEQDAFVTKFNASGSGLIYSTYVGGGTPTAPANDFASAVAVDGSGNAYIFGQTNATDFPVVNAFQSRIGNPSIRFTDFFVSKINASGSAFVYSSYLGGGNNEFIFGQGSNIALDASNNAYVAGLTQSNNYPTTANAFRPFAFSPNVNESVVSVISDTGTTYSISGRITQADGTPVADAFLFLSGNNFTQQTRTDSQGFYQFVSVPNGSYTVFPSGSGSQQYRYEPTSAPVTVNNADVRDINFTATPVLTIFGRITDANNPSRGISNVTVTLSGSAQATTTTDGNGFFQFTNLMRGTYTVTPSRTSATGVVYTFNPPSQTFNDVSTNQTASFTTPSAQFFSISGRIADASGAPVADVSVSLNGLRPASTRTDASGNFTFTDLQEGESYTLTPAKLGLFFTPQRAETQPLNGNVTANFTATQATGLAGKIAFVRGFSTFDNEQSQLQYDIFTVNADTTNPTNITNTPDASDLYPAWSPDGTRLVFARDNDEGQDFISNIFVMNADGSNVVQLTSSGQDFEPSFSPDGTQIIFSRVNDTGVQIWLMNADGSNQRQLTNTPDVANFDPSFSPDGTRIVFVRTSNEDNSRDIFIMNADGSNVVRLTNIGIFNDNESRSTFSPVFSPDGTKIAFGVFEFSRGDNFLLFTSKSDIYLMNADGTNQQNITRAPNGEQNFEPTFSPDGARLAFRSDNDRVSNGVRGIFAINLDGTNRTQITDPPQAENSFTFDLLPAWQPTGAPPQQTFTVTGRVTNAGGAGVSNITVNITQENSNVSLATATTNADGTYTATVRFIAATNYVATPARQGATFTPASRTFASPASANSTVSGIDFTASGVTFLNSSYTSQASSPFSRTINTGNTFLETFEDGALNTPGVTASTSSVIGPGGLTDSVDGDDGAIDGSGTNGRSLFSGNGAAGITFTFNAAVLGRLPTQAGIVWTDGEGTTIFEAFDASGASLGTLGPVSIADNSASGTTTEDRFFGVTFESGISAIKISNTAGGIEVDHLQYGLFDAPTNTLTVTNTNDSGAGSLRQAILDSNATQGTQTIAFNIPGQGVQTITPASPLPTITDPVRIDGTTQPGFAGTPIIEIDGATVGSQGAGFSITAGNSEMRGMIINRFTGAFVLQQNGNNVIAGNYIGVNAAGTAAIGNIFSGIAIENNSNNNTIGGTSPGDRNIISGNGTAGRGYEGIRIFNSSGNRVLGNFIGTNAAGTAAIPNSGGGIIIGFGGTPAAAPNNIIGGTTAGSRNIISGHNGFAGIGIFDPGSTGNQILGNFIGTDVTGTTAIPNTDGIDISSSNNIVGGTAEGAGNRIAFNFRGVSVSAGANIGNSIRGNAIFSNGSLGIELGFDGVTPNDTNDTDTGANNLQNFPVLTSAIAVNSGATTISGTLNSTPNTTFNIQFFVNDACDASGNGEGQTLVRSFGVTTDASGNVGSFGVVVSAAAGQFITATATDAAGNTSEFSACRQVTAELPQVDLSITKTDSPDPVTVGNALTYTINVTNNSTPEASGVTVTDALPAGVTFVSATSSLGSCAQSNNTVTCNLGTLPGGNSATISIVVTLTQAGTLTNTANVTSANQDTNTVNNSATQSTTINAATNTFSISGRVADPANTSVSGVTLRVTNAGGQTIANATSDANGNYTVTGLAEGGSYVVTPSGGGLTFTPSFRRFDNLAANQANISFTGANITFVSIRDAAGFRANVLAANDDFSTERVPLGFTINFFGTNYDSLFVNNNGNVTFDAALSDFTPFDLTATQSVIIAAFFADVDTRGAGSGLVTYGTDTINGRPAFGANWINVGYFFSRTDKLNSFQIVLIDRSDITPGSFDIELNYDKIQWETGEFDDGVDGLGGMSARAGYSNGTRNAGTFFELNGSGINGAFLDSNPMTGLANNNLNSDQRGRYSFSVRNGVVTTYAISGRIATTDNTPVANVNVVLSGSTSATTATDANGNYTFAGLAAGGDYVVTPSLNNTTFSPPNFTFNDIQTNQTANFTANLPPANLSISGRITDANGNPLVGITVALTDSSVSPTPNPTPTPSPTPTPTPTPSPTPTPLSQPLNADYRFQNTLASSVGTAPALQNLGNNTFLTDTVDGTQRTVLRFNRNDGLQLSPTTGVLPNNGSYTIVMLFKFDNVDDYRRLIDFRNGTSDDGLYIQDGVLEVCRPPFNACTVTTTPIPANTYVQLVFTRENDFFRAYVNGQLQGAANLQPGTFQIDGNNVLRFFRDDGSEASAGSIARLRLYPAPLLNSEITTLDRLPSSAPGDSESLADAAHSKIINRLLSSGFVASPESLQSPAFPFTSSFAASLIDPANLPNPFTSLLQLAAPSALQQPDPKPLATVTTTTDVNGNYAFTNLTPNQSYSVVPSSTNFTFQPPRRDFANLTTNAIADFIATRRVIQNPPAGTLRISGRIADVSNVSIPNITVTLSGAVSLTTTTDDNGNYSFINLAASSYSIVPTAFDYSFTPARRDLTLTGGDQTVNFTATFIPNPQPTPLPQDGFDNPQTTAEQFNEGTLTQAGNFNPNVSVDVRNNQLEITPLPATNAPAFNGLVSTRALDLNESPNVSVEVKQVTNGDGAQTTFAVGSSGSNFFRFVVSAPDLVPASVSAQNKSIKRSREAIAKPTNTTGQQLTFQAVMNNQLFTTGITYNPTAHRYWRFRNDAVKQQVFFETSPDAQVWTIQFPKEGQEYPAYALGSVSALASELSAGTLRSTANPGTAIFDNYAVSDPPAVGFGAASFSVGESQSTALVTVTRTGDVDSAAVVNYMTANGTAIAGVDYVQTSGTLNFRAGERSQSFNVTILNNPASNADKTFNLILRDAVGTTLTPGRDIAPFVIIDADTRRPNPIDNLTFLIRQQIQDLFNRIAPNNLTPSAGGTRTRTRSRARTRTSKVDTKRQVAAVAALFASDEFKNVNTFVPRIYRVAFGRNVTFTEAFSDLPRVSAGVLRADNRINTQTLLRNKRGLAEDFTMRGEFQIRYGNLGATEYVDALYTNAGISTSEVQAERAALILGLITNRETKASVLRRIADNSTFTMREMNRAVVLFAYFDFFRANPSDETLAAQLSRLNQASSLAASGILQDFITSREYRSRFGRP